MLVNLIPSLQTYILIYNFVVLKVGAGVFYAVKKASKWQSLCQSSATAAFPGEVQFIISKNFNVNIFSFCAKTNSRK